MKKQALSLILIAGFFFSTVFSFAQNSGEHREQTKMLKVTDTNRPLRTPRDFILTIGQTQGDLVGRDDKIIQAGIDYLNRLGGGTLYILPGVYDMKNSICLHPNITIKGSGDNTILRSAPGFTTPLVRHIERGEYGVHVKDPTGFAQGAGIMLRTSAEAAWAIDVFKATVTRIEGDVIYFDKMADKDFHLEKECTAATIYPIISAENVDNVYVEDLVLDGNKDQNEHINGNFSGAVFLYRCNNWKFKNVTARKYNGDGFSWQTCDDIHFENCKALDNTDLGFHPGTGSQRPVLTNCTAIGNSQGLYFCWNVSDGFVDECNLSGNLKYGISIGHRDTENIIQNCLVQDNGEVGILFRKDGDDEFYAGNRNLITSCTIKDNGLNKGGIGIDIRWKTKDITIEKTKFISSGSGIQKIGIQISKDAERISTSGNTFENIETEIKKFNR